MENNELNKNILEKVENKIAISNFKKEEFSMSKNKILKMVATFVISIGITMGVVYAGTVVYEKIWKQPQRVDLSNEEITQEIIDKNVTEEEAKEIAKNKLVEIGLENEEIVGTDNYKISGTEKIMYRFNTNNKWLITINGTTGEFFDLILNDYDKTVENYKISRNEAIEIAKEYYKKLGYKDGEYKLAQLSALNNDGIPTGDGYRFDATFHKQYDGLYNKYESVYISFYAKNKQLFSYRVESNKFENNPLEISKEKAIEIATAEDRKIESKPIISTEAELRIERMNGNAYARLNNTEEYYKPMTTTDVPTEEIVAYKTENRIRRVWVVSFNYAEQEGEDVVTRYAKYAYSYFVDSTTGEIIGGDNGDYLRWDNLWAKKLAVE